MAVIWFIRLVEITSRLWTLTSGCHLRDRGPLVFWSLIWLSPGMSKPIMALMRETEVRSNTGYCSFGLVRLLYKSVAWWVKTHVSACNSAGKKCFVTHLIFYSVENDSTTHTRMRFQPSVTSFCYYFLAFFLCFFKSNQILCMWNPLLGNKPVSYSVFYWFFFFLKINALKTKKKYAALLTGQRY